MKFNNNWKLYHTVWFCVVLIIVTLEILVVVKKAVEKEYIKFPEKQEKHNYIYPSSTPTPTLTPTPTIFVPQYAGQKPIMAAFMRRGQIWVKDYVTSEERKVSQTEPVEGPNLSPSGNFVYYYDIVYASGGYPRYRTYIADIHGNAEYKLSGATNFHGSKFKWSEDGHYLGVVYLDDNPRTKTSKVYLYDTSKQQEILVGTSIPGDDIYDVDDTCTSLSDESKEFCIEYVSFLKKPRTSMYLNNAYEKYKNLSNEYTLGSTIREDNGTIRLDFYKGKALHPYGGIGMYIPGYDEGVTDTYSILIDAHTDEVIDRIQNAVETDYIF